METRNNFTSHSENGLKIEIHRRCDELKLPCVLKSEHKCRMCGRGDPALPDEAHGDTEHPCNQYIPVEIWNLLGDLEDREKSRPKYGDRADDYSQSQDRVRRSATYSRAPTSRSSADNRATSRGRQRQYASPPSGPSCPEAIQRSNADSLGYQSREEGGIKNHIFLYRQCCRRDSSLRVRLNLRTRTRRQRN